MLILHEGTVFGQSCGSRSSLILLLRGHFAHLLLFRKPRAPSRIAAPICKRRHGSTLKSEKKTKNDLKSLSIIRYEFCINMYFTTRYRRGSSPAISVIRMRNQFSYIVNKYYNYNRYKNIFWKASQPY